MQILVDAHWSQSDLWLELSISSSVQPGELYWQSSGGKSVDRWIFFALERGSVAKGSRDNVSLGHSFVYQGGLSMPLFSVAPRFMPAVRSCISFQKERRDAFDYT